MGITYLLFTPSEFLEKITALIPPPRQHQMSPKFSDVAVLRPIHLISPRSALSQKPKKASTSLTKMGIWVVQITQNGPVNSLNLSESIS